MHESFNSFVKMVTGKDGRITVDKVLCAAVCSAGVNPNVISAQMEGGTGFGFPPTLIISITLGARVSVEQLNFHDYQVLRLN